MLAIEFAEKHYSHKKVEHIVSSIFDIDFPEEYFDVIVSIETIEHVDNEKAIRTLAGKLKKNGLLIVSTPNQEKLPFTKEMFPFHLKHLTTDEFESLLTKNGLNIEGKFTQHDREKSEVLEGWDGVINIAVARKGE